MMKRWMTAALLGSALAVAHAAPQSLASWKFRVLLNDSPIGIHTFTLTGDDERREMRSEAEFAVKFVGITAYRYRHQAVERWRGDCLSALTASTDDNGKKTTVNAKRDGDALDVVSPEGNRSLSGCAMTFAYWNPEMLLQSRLLNAQTGQYESVQIRNLGSADFESRGATVKARRYRIEGPANPIELWYSADGDWLGLDSMINGRKLSYRLE